MDYRFGTLAANIIAPNMKAGARMPGPLEFFPWHKAPEPLLLPPDQLAAAFDRMVGA